MVGTRGYLRVYAPAGGDTIDVVCFADARNLTSPDFVAHGVL